LFLRLAFLRFFVPDFLLLFVLDLRFIVDFLLLFVLVFLRIRLCRASGIGSFSESTVCGFCANQSRTVIPPTKPRTPPAEAAMPSGKRSHFFDIYY